VDDPATNNLSGILNLIIDIFVMPTLFFVSGYLTPRSLKSKGGMAFLESRFKRLMIPWLIAVLTLIPLYKFIFLHSRNLPQESWTTYFHFSNGNISSQNWLWFLPVLFLFNLLFVLLSRVDWVPTSISLRFAVAAIFLIGVVNSFSMDLLKVRGWTLTPLIDFQNERLLVYFMMFLLGALCFRQQVFAARPKSKKLFTVANSTAWVPICVYIVFLLNRFINPGSFMISSVVDGLIYWLSFHLSLLCMLYVLIGTFWRYFDKPGRLWKELNRNSYDVYIIHVIVLGGIALPLLNSAMPSLVKYLTLTVATYAASNFLVSLSRLATGRRRATDNLNVP
jgi:fucose 4-O-acetylase-like acetyltransferase